MVLNISENPSDIQVKCTRPVVPACAGCAMAHPDFGRSANPISTRGDRLCPPNYYWHFQTFRRPCVQVIVPGGFSYLTNWNNYKSYWKNYWDLETCRKSQKNNFLSMEHLVTTNIFFIFQVHPTAVEASVPLGKKVRKGEDRNRKKSKSKSRKVSKNQNSERSPPTLSTNTTPTFSGGSIDVTGRNFYISISNSYLIFRRFILQYNQFTYISKSY